VDTDPGDVGAWVTDVRAQIDGLLATGR
jgi:hypothetical protein